MPEIITVFNGAKESRSKVDQIVGSFQIRISDLQWQIYLEILICYLFILLSVTKFSGQITKSCSQNQW